MGGDGHVSAGYITMLVAVLEALKEETLLKVTEYGPPVIELMKSVYTRQAGDFFVGAVSRLEACL